MAIALDKVDPSVVCSMKKVNCILLVDDDPISIFLTERLLWKLGAADEVEIALNGNQAFEIIEERLKKGRSYPQVIFLDINMPVMSGIDFLHLLKEKKITETAGTDIVVLSTSTHHKDQKQISEMGVKHIVQKPLTESKLQKVWEETGRI